MKPFNLIIILLISFISIEVSAQTIQPLNWLSGSELPETRAEGVAILAPNDNILFMGGLSSLNGQSVLKLTAGESTWTLAPNLDTPRVSPGVVRHGMSGILVFAGTGGGEASDETLAYDYIFGDSQDVAKMITARRQFAFAADSFGNAYAIGGMDNNNDVLFDVEYYDSGLDIWRQIVDLPDARYAASGVGDNNGNVFVFGGVSATGDIVDSVFCYSTTEDAWVTLAPMPVPVKNSAAVFIAGFIYIVGGTSADGPVATVQVYDLATGEWVLDTDLPEARTSHTAVIDALGQMLVIGGYDSNNVATSSIYHSQRLTAPEQLPVITSAPITVASLDKFYHYDVTATGNPEPIFSLLQAPTGMHIDDKTSLISWQPIVGQVGNHEVIVRASNRVGDADQTFNIIVLTDTIAPTSPTNLNMDVVGETYVDLSWTAASDTIGVDHYALFKSKRCGWRNSRTCYAPVDLQQNIPQTHTKVTGLLPLSFATYAVRAIDAAGNASGFSNRVSVQTLSIPINFQYSFNGTANLPVILPAKSLLELQLFSSANPVATYTLLSGPQGMLVDSVSGLVQWTPAVTDVGDHQVIFQASNSVGNSSLTVTITVANDVPQLSVQFNPTSGGARYAVAGVPFTAQVSDASNTPPTYSLVTAPTGMSIGVNSGLINWLPTANQAGLTNVTLRSTSSAGVTDLSFNFYTHFTGSVSAIQVSNLTALHPLVNWTAPIGTGANLIQGYTLVAIAKYRWGRSRLTDRVEYNSTGTGTQFELTGLTSGRDYKLSINAYDASGNRGLVNPSVVSVMPRPALPNVSWKVSNANGGAHIIAEQAMVIQLTDNNAAISPSTFSIVHAPAGLTLDPTTGVARWTPSASDVGAVSITLQATNSVGPRDVRVNVNVLFSGPVLNAAAFRVGQSTSASANWSAPTDNVLPIVSYQVTMHWKWSSRNRSRTMTATGTSIEFSLIPTGAVWHRGVTIAPVDAMGRIGVSTPLILYGSIAPPPPTNVAPVANAGADQSIALPHSAVTLTGSASDDGLPNFPGQLSYSWSVVSAPDTVTFGNATAASSTVSFSGEGVYTLRLTVSDGELSHQDDVIITLNPEPQPVNMPPVANAGQNQMITLPDNNIALNGSATDDGLPLNPGGLTYQWHLVSGPEVVDFDNPNALNSSVTFLAAGDYILQLTVSDGLLSHAANVGITVNPEPVITVPSTPPPFDINAPKVELESIIQEVGANYIIVDGIKIWYVEATIIKFEEDEGDTFQMGQAVNLKASLNADGSATALKIQIGG